MSEIIISIKPDGAVTVEVDGVKGAGCMELTEQIEKALGTVSSNIKKKEYYERDEKGKRTVVNKA